MSHSIRQISKFSEAFVSCYSSSELSKILDQVDSFDEFLESNQDVNGVFCDHFVDKDLKHQIVDKLSDSFDEFLSNFLHILIDRNMIYHLKLFLATIRNRIHKFLSIQNIYVFSSFKIDDSRRKKLEELWKARVSASKHQFFYFIDKSLKLGIKVQVDSFVDEFSIASNLQKMKLKFESIKV